MNKNRWLLLSLAGVAWFNAGTVWPIQFSCYPLWSGVGREQFAEYFQVWQQSTRAIVDIPFALAAIGSLVLLLTAWRELPKRLLCLGVVLQVAIEFVRLLGYPPSKKMWHFFHGKRTVPSIRD